MPHENVWDCMNHHTEADGTKVPPTQRRGVVSWSHGPTPSDEYSEPDGWVQLMTEDTGKPARFDATEEETMAQLADLLTTFRFEDAESRGKVSEELILALARFLAPHVRHAFGDMVGGFAVTLDRSGINRTIRLLQRARDIAHGKDA